MVELFDWNQYGAKTSGGKTNWSQYGSGFNKRSSETTATLDFLEKKKREYERLFSTIEEHNLPTEPRTNWWDRWSDLGGRGFKWGINYLFPGSYTDRIIARNIKTAVTRGREQLGHPTLGFESPKTIGADIKDQWKALWALDEYKDYHSTKMYSEVFPKMTEKLDYNVLNPLGLISQILYNTPVGDKMDQFAKDMYKKATGGKELTPEMIDNLPIFKDKEALHPVIKKFMKISNMGMDLNSILKSTLKYIVANKSIPITNKQQMEMFRAGFDKYYEDNPWAKSKFAYFVPGSGILKAIDMIGTATDAMTDSPAALAGLGTQIIDDPLTWLDGAGIAAKGTMGIIKFGNKAKIARAAEVIATGSAKAKIVKRLTAELGDAAKAISKTDDLLKTGKILNDDSIYKIYREVPEIRQSVDATLKRFGVSGLKGDLKPNKFGTDFLRKTRQETYDEFTKNPKFIKQVDDETAQTIIDTQTKNAIKRSQNIDDQIAKLETFPNRTPEINSQIELLRLEKFKKGTPGIDQVNLFDHATIKEITNPKIIEMVRLEVEARKIAELTQKKFLEATMKNPDIFFDKGGIKFAPDFTKYRKDFIPYFVFEKTRIPELGRLIANKTPAGVKELLSKIRDLLSPAGNAPRELHEAFLDTMKILPPFNKSILAVSIKRTAEKYGIDFTVSEGKRLEALMERGKIMEALSIAYEWVQSPEGRNSIDSAVLEALQSSKTFRQLPEVYLKEIDKLQKKLPSLERDEFAKTQARIDELSSMSEYINPYPVRVAGRSVAKAIADEKIIKATADYAIDPVLKQARIDLATAKSELFKLNRDKANPNIIKTIENKIKNLNASIDETEQLITSPGVDILTQRKLIPKKEVTLNKLKSEYIKNTEPYIHNESDIAALISDRLKFGNKRIGTISPSSNLEMQQLWKKLPEEFKGAKKYNVEMVGRQIHIPADSFNVDQFRDIVNYLNKDKKGYNWLVSPEKMNSLNVDELIRNVPSKISKTIEGVPESALTYGEKKLQALYIQMRDPKSPISKYVKEWNISKTTKVKDSKSITSRMSENYVEEINRLQKKLDKTVSATAKFELSKRIRELNIKNKDLLISPAKKDIYKYKLQDMFEGAKTSTKVPSVIRTIAEIPGITKERFADKVNDIIKKGEEFNSAHVTKGVQESASSTVEKLLVRMKNILDRAEVKNVEISKQVSSSITDSIRADKESLQQLIDRQKNIMDRTSPEIYIAKIKEVTDIRTQKQKDFRNLKNNIRYLRDKGEFGSDSIPVEKVTAEFIRLTEDIIDIDTGDILVKSELGRVTKGDVGFISEVRDAFQNYFDIENYKGYNVKFFETEEGWYVPLIPKVKSDLGFLSSYGITTSSPSKIIEESMAAEKARHFKNPLAGNLYYGTDHFETDLFKIWESRGGQDIKAVATKNFINISKSYGIDNELTDKWNESYKLNKEKINQSIFGHTETPATKISFVNDENVNIQQTVDIWKDSLQGRKFKVISATDSPRGNLVTFLAEDENWVKNILAGSNETAESLVKKNIAGRLSKTEQTLYNGLFKEYDLVTQKGVFKKTVKDLKYASKETNPLVVNMARAKTIEELGFDPKNYTYKISDVEGLTGHSFTPATGQYLDKTTKFFADEYVEKTLKFFDNFTRWWKPFATVIFPGFTSRNEQSNLFNLMLKDGLKAFDPEMHKIAIAMISGREGELNIAGRIYKYSELSELADRHGMHGFAMTDIDVTSLQRGSVSALEGIRKKRNIFSVEGPWVQTGLKFSSFFETESKFVGWLNDFIATGDPAFAARRTNEFLFNYADTSKFTNAVLKRVFPFITWSTKNIPLQWKNLFINPRIYAMIPKIKNYLGAGADLPEDYEENVPDYYNEMMAMPTRFKSQTGKTMVYNPNVAFQDLTKVSPKDFLSMLNPPLKMILELAANRQMFSEAPIWAKSSANLKETPGWIAKLVDLLPDKMLKGSLINKNPKTGKIYTPAMVDYLLSQFPLYTNLGKAFPQSKITGPLADSSMLFGVKFFEYDPKTTEYFKYKDEIPELEALIDYYKKVGLMEDTRPKQ